MHPALTHSIGATTTSHYPSSVLLDVVLRRNNLLPAQLDLLALDSIRTTERDSPSHTTCTTSSSALVVRLLLDVNLLRLRLRVAERSAMSFSTTTSGRGDVLFCRQRRGLGQLIFYTQLQIWIDRGERTTRLLIRLLFSSVYRSKKSARRTSD